MENSVDCEIATKVASTTERIHDRCFSLAPHNVGIWTLHRGDRFAIPRDDSVRVNDALNVSMFSRWRRPRLQKSRHLHVSS